ncbi:MAG: ribonuclease R [Flavobacteriaceae bacterium]|nr:ribonuclease R [Bacteroidia bacterium]NNK86951.1 ribonuclease R [Flavobacteriaceae bacterium]
MPRKKKKKRSNNIQNLSSSVINILKSDRNRSFNYKQIASKLNLDDPSSRNQIIKTLQRFKEKGDLIEVSRGKFQFNSADVYSTGIIELNRNGGGYVYVEDLQEEVFIASNNLHKSLNGDEVELYIFKRRKRGRLEGEITRIIKRERTEFVGIIHLSKNFAFVVPDSNKMYIDIFVPKNKSKRAEDGDKVIVQIEEWPEKADSPIGKVIEVLGKPGEHDTEIHAILADYGLPYEFPKEVERFADKLDTSIRKEEISKRRDFRKVLTFTIDPKDAKDFDDALSFRILKNGNYEIGIHIADVTHYLQEGTALDDEAFERGTSVYLVDRVVPMLPEVLSNKACSLRPREEKYTFSAVFEMDENAKLKSQWFGRTVIYSDARFAYEEAQEIIETRSSKISKTNSLTGKAYETSKPLAEAILKLDQLAKIMRKKRMQAGAISFDKAEVKFHLDENNDPTGVYFKITSDANHLIEEFMLMANKKVAEFIGKQKSPKTFVYRIHDEPDDEKLANLQSLVAKFGYKVNFQSHQSISTSLNKLLNDVVGKKEQHLVDTLAIRSMSKAEYSVNNIGHYGLAFRYYTHFTSPIRRYPDVMVHRLLQHYLNGGKSAKEEVYEERCNHASKMEYLATKAERDSIKYMQVKFMQDHKDQEFKGVISGVTDWGIYVEIISNGCEGMVRIRDIQDDYYTFDKEHHALIGDRTKNSYQLGEEVIVKVKKADLVQKHLDFHLVGKADDLI